MTIHILKRCDVIDLICSSQNENRNLLILNEIIIELTKVSSTKPINFINDQVNSINCGVKN